MSKDPFRVYDWDDYQGQSRLKERLQVHVDGAMDRGDRLDHILLFGPPGCGKTTLGGIIANKMYMPYATFLMPIKDEVLMRIVNTHDGVALFDEIHRLSPKQQENLLPLIEDGFIQLPDGGKMYAGDRFTVIGATTEPENIIEPLRDRFPIRPVFDDYSDRDIAKIIEGMGKRLGDVWMTRRQAVRLARACGGVPRNAKMFVKMAQDLGGYDVNVDEILRICRVTGDGLTYDHVSYLRSLDDCGGKAGVDILQAHVRLSKTAMIDLERLLIKRDMIQYTKGGRVLTSKGYKALKDLPEDW